MEKMQSACEHLTSASQIIAYSLLPFYPLPLESKCER